MTPLLTLPEVKIALGISDSTLLRLRRRGHLRVVTLGPSCIRVRPEDLEESIKKRTTYGSLTCRR